MMNILLSGVSASAITAGLGGGSSYTWSQVLNTLLDGVSTGWAGYNIRQVFDATLFTDSASAMRFIFGSYTSSGLEITSCYVGIGSTTGDIYDFKTTPTQVFFGGNPGFTIAQNSYITSDPVDLAFVGGVDSLVVAWYCSDSANDDLRRKTTAAGYENVYKQSATNESNLVDVTSYSGHISNRLAITSVEFSP